MSRWQVLDDDGLPTGSYTASELLTLWRDGTLDHTALVWTDGMAEWIAIADTQSRLQQEEADAPAHAVAAADPNATVDLNFTTSAWAPSHLVAAADPDASVNLNFTSSAWDPDALHEAMSRYEAEGEPPVPEEMPRRESSFGSVNDLSLIHI